MLSRIKGPLIFWLDVFNALAMVALAFTGAVMKWVLPPGSGGGRGFGEGGRHARATLYLGLSRHDWGDVHFWIALALVAGIVVHVLLHVGWVKAAIRKHLVPRTLRPVAT